MNYYLGVDAGGTKTTAVVIDENSKIVAQVRGGPANYHNIGLNETVSDVAETINEVLEIANLSMTAVKGCAIGITANDTPNDYKLLKQAFADSEIEPLTKRLTLVNDTKIGLYCGTLPPGIVVICGTGANVYGINSHGEEAIAGNWGHFLGDKGSGYNLGQRLLQTVIEDYDGVREATALTNRIEEKLNVKSTSDIVDWYWRTRPGVMDISDLAPLAIAAAEEGDEMGRKLVDRTIKELGRPLMAVVRRLKMEEEYCRVVIVGGLFESKYYRGVFEGHVTALIKRVRVVKPLVPPAVGAAIMAKQVAEKE